CLLVCPCACGGHDRALRSFPTRRSSDLATNMASGYGLRHTPLSFQGHKMKLKIVERGYENFTGLLGVTFFTDAVSNDDVNHKERSEEHTSELQSREKLVCRLLLEKKKRQ